MTSLNKITRSNLEKLFKERAQYCNNTVRYEGNKKTTVKYKRSIQLVKDDSFSYNGKLFVHEIVNDDNGKFHHVSYGFQKRLCHVAEFHQSENNVDWKAVMKYHTCGL